MEPGIDSCSYVFLELVKDKAMARFGHRRQAYPLTRFDLAHRIAPLNQKGLPAVTAAAPESSASTTAGMCALTVGRRGDEED